MDVFLILQILFDAVLLFGILFLFHFSVNEQQKKKEEFDIVKNIQVQEMKENLEKLLSTMKQLGKDVSDDIQRKIDQSEEKNKDFNLNFKKLENQLKTTSEPTGEVDVKKVKRGNKIKVIGAMTNKKEDFPSDNKNTDKTSSLMGKKTKRSIPRNGHSIGFSSEIIKRVYKMIDINKDISEVVKETKLTKAEINLILNLRVNRFTTQN